VVESLNLALSPIIFNLMNDENNKRFYSKIMTYLVFLILIIIVGASLFSKEIIIFLARKPEYYDAYKIIPIITFSALFMMMRDTAIRALNIVKKTTIISIVVICVSIFNVCMNLILIKKYDIYGASFTFLMTQMLYFGLIYIFAQKFYFIPYEKGKLLLMIIISVIMLSIGQIYLTDITWINFFFKMALLALFPIILYFFNFYEKAELQKIRELVFLKK
jgi:O-antigen/teichoic acid export membrane protein